jgi:hypothetical protein
MKRIKVISKWRKPVKQRSRNRNNTGGAARGVKPYGMCEMQTWKGEKVACK